MIKLIVLLWRSNHHFTLGQALLIGLVYILEILVVGSPRTQESLCAAFSLFRSLSAACCCVPNSFRKSCIDGQVVKWRRFGMLIGHSSGRGSWWPGGVVHYNWAVEHRPWWLWSIVPWSKTWAQLRRPYLIVIHSSFIRYYASSCELAFLSNITLKLLCGVWQIKFGKIRKSLVATTWTLDFLINICIWIVHAILATFTANQLIIWSFILLQWVRVWPFTRILFIFLTSCLFRWALIRFQ